MCRPGSYTSVRDNSVLSRQFIKEDLSVDESTKEALDVAAASTAVMSLAAWLPPTASLLTIVWLGLRIYESKTVQGFLNKDKE